MKVLLAGVDTLQLGFHARAESKLRLRIVREDIEHAVNAPPGEQFLRFPNGEEWAAVRGGRFHVGGLERAGIKLMVGREEFAQNAAVTAEVGSQACHELGLAGAWRRAHGLASAMLELEPARASLSRVDLCVDTTGLDFGAVDREAWVSVKRDGKEQGPDPDEQHAQRWYTGSAVNSFRFGSRRSGAMVRIYDKLRELAEQSPDKAWFGPLWAKHNGGVIPTREDGVWRTEVELKRSGLKGEVWPKGEGAHGPSLPVDTLEGLLRAIPYLWRLYLTQRLRLTLPSDRDSNRARWPLRPEWSALANVDWSHFAVEGGAWIKAEAAAVSYEELLPSLRGMLLRAVVLRGGELDLAGGGAGVLRDIARLDHERGRDWKAEAEVERARLGTTGPVGEVA